MLHRPDRTTVDLSEYPDLVVIYLGQRVNSLRGLKTLLSFRAKISKSVDAQPDGLLLHENLLYSLVNGQLVVPVCGHLKVSTSRVLASVC